MRLLFAPLLLLSAPWAAQAQSLFGRGATFADGPERHEVTGELTYLDVDAPCALTVAIGVDRAGRIVSAEIVEQADACADTALRARALRSVRERTFPPARNAPAVQHGTVRWEFQPPASDVGFIDGPSEPPLLAQEGERTYTSVEEPPQFPGGEDAMDRYIRLTMQYPPEAREAGKQGVVYLSFVVDAEGLVGSVTVLRGVDPELDREALRIVKGMPTWRPGKQNGKPVRVRWTLPVTFRIP